MPAPPTLTGAHTAARLERLVDTYPDIGNALQLGKFRSTSPHLINVRAPKFPGSEKSPTLAYHSSDPDEIVIQEPASSASLATFATGKHALAACTLLVRLLETLSADDSSEDDIPLSTMSRRQDLVRAMLCICGASGTEFGEDPFVRRVAMSHDQLGAVKQARLSILLAICDARARQIDKLPATIMQEHHRHPRAPILLLFDDANDPDLGGRVTDYTLRGCNRLGATWARVVRFYGKQRGVFAA